MTRGIWTADALDAWTRRQVDRLRADKRAAIEAGESYARELAALDPEKRETPPA